MSIDSKTIKDPEVDGLSYSIEIEPDLDASPDDADCYTETQKAAWRRDEWSYVGVIVTPVINGTELSEFDDSLWGLEYGDFTLTDEDDNVTGHVYLDMDAFTTRTVHELTDGVKNTFGGYPVPDMISEVRGKLHEGLGAVVDALRKVEAGTKPCPATHVRTEGIQSPFEVHCERTAGHDMPHRVMDYEWSDNETVLPMWAGKERDRP